ncbi:MAG: hypothetical protein BWX97_01644 [Firmicutes bacterium ADurb.Bin146]|nr:MAG: hypothetical protein BWX97_01644 [Firmicutes bacterium ADurb.Bin146]
MRISLKITYITVTGTTINSTLTLEGITRGGWEMNSGMQAVSSGR